MKTLKLTSLLLFLALESVSARNIRICFTSDVQGNYTPSTATWISPTFPPPLGSAASLRTFLEVEKPDLLLDAGNFWGLSPAGSTRRIEAGIYVARDMEYDAMSVGIDDLFKGVRFLEGISKEMDCEFISSSLVDSAGNWIFEPFRIFQINGVKIGVTGYISSHAEWFLPHEILNENRVLKENDALSIALDSLNQENCDIVIALSHSSFRHDTLTANSIAGIDIIIGGFDGFAGTWESSLNHTLNFRIHTGLSSVGLIDLELNEDGSITGWKFSEINLFTESYNPDEEILNKLRDILGNSNNR
ncbi:hypothetical protein JXA84_04645 [candidate division WOR-3 bacterium]|nr:hypothetical protein [candidate division WOR-3 bacterium]